MASRRHDRALQAANAAWIDSPRADQDGHLRLFREFQNLARHLSRSPQKQIISEVPVSVSMRDYERTISLLATPPRRRSRSSSRPSLANTSPEAMPAVQAPLGTPHSAPHSFTAPMAPVSPAGQAPSSPTASSPHSAQIARKIAESDAATYAAEQDSAAVHDELNRMRALVGRLSTDLSAQDLDDSDSLRADVLRKVAALRELERSAGKASGSPTNYTESPSTNPTVQALEQLQLEQQRQQQEQEQQEGGSDVEMLQLKQQLRTMQEQYRQRQVQYLEVMAQLEEQKLAFETAQTLHQRELAEARQQAREKEAQCQALQSKINEFDRMLQQEMQAVADTMQQLQHANKRLVAENIQLQRALNSGSTPERPVAPSEPALAELRAENLTLKTDVTLLQRENEALRSELADVRRLVEQLHDSAKANQQ